MGNCQAVDAASLVIQHQNGKVEKMYSPLSAAQIMKMNPGHYVALLITTTIFHSSKSDDAKTNSKNSAQKHSSMTGFGSVRITRVKLLRPTDTLTLGHVYRLISTKEVMKGLVAKKQAQMKKNGIELEDSQDLTEVEKMVKKALQDTSKTYQASRHGQRSRTTSSANKGTKTWQPSLNSISEFAS